MKGKSNYAIRLKHAAFISSPAFWPFKFFQLEGAGQAWIDHGEIGLERK
jgi:hypothetical protein